MQRFFFTFGTSDKFPFHGGWVEVVAHDRAKAVATYRSRHPDVNEGIINCSDIYTEEQFMGTEMVQDNLGAPLRQLKIAAGICPRKTWSITLTGGKVCRMVISLLLANTAIPNVRFTVNLNQSLNRRTTTNCWRSSAFNFA